MGAFDNLIPKPTPDQTPGQFDNLIPANPKPPPGAFDHLIPQPAQQPIEQPSVAKEYWDATKKAVTDITGDVKAGYGDKSLTELWKTESLPAHLYQGAKRLVNGEPEKPKEDKSSESMMDTLKGLGVTLKDRPGLAIGSLTKTIAADPELLLPWLWEAIPEATAAKVAQAAKAMGASTDIAKAAEIGGRVAGRMGVGAATNVAIEGGDQFAKGNLDAGALGTAATEGAAFSLPGRFAGETPKGILRALDEEVAHPAVADAPVSSVGAQMDLDLTPAEAKAVAEVPEERLTALGETRESLAQATSEDPITPEMIAEVGKEPIRPPNESRERLVKAIRNSVVGGAIGGGVGYWAADDSKKSIGVETGVLLGAGLPLLKVRPYQGPDISSLVNARNGQVRVVARHVYQFQNQIEKLIPVRADREAISEMIDRGVEPEVGTPQHEAYTNLKQFFADMGQVAVDHGVVDALRDNYISHIVEEDPTKRTGIIAKIFGGGQSSGSGGTSGKSFGKERKYDTFEDLNTALKDSGLRIKTKDASEIAGIYANAVYKSVADKQLLDAVKGVRMADGTSIAMPVKPAKGMPKPPSDYVTAAAPQLQGVAIHPDVAPDLGFIYSHRNPNWVVRKAEQLTSAVKRTAVSFSMFHAKTLIENFMVASQNATDKLNPVGAAKAAMKMYREGGDNGVIDRGLKNGLILGTPEDVAGHEIQNWMTDYAQFANDRLPLKGLGTAQVAKGMAKLDKGLEHFTFGFLQTGFKINVFSSEYERLIGRGMTKDKAARAASSLTNDIFGSLDYYRVATDTDSHIMRKLGTASLGLNARKVLQLAMFAPDWTLGTFRSLAKAMPGGATDATVSQIHRRYLIKNALYYFTVANGINYAMSGHSLFSNKNHTRVELGDGRTMQFSKHTMEPMDWLRDPFNTAGNKLGFLPGAMWKAKGEYDRAAAYNKPTTTPAQFVAGAVEGMAPISLQEFVQNGVSPETATAALFGLAGFPIYGKSDEQKAKDKEKRKQERQEAKANAVN